MCTALRMLLLLLLLPTESVAPACPPLATAAGTDGRRLVAGSAGFPVVSPVVVPSIVLAVVRTLVVVVGVGVGVRVEGMRVRLSMNNTVKVLSIGRELVLQGGGSVEQSLVRPVLAQSRRRQGEKRQDLLSVEQASACRYSVITPGDGCCQSSLYFPTHLNAPERTPSPSSSTQTLRISSVWRTLRTQPTTLSASSN